jgi:hypothetical protein
MKVEPIAIEIFNRELTQPPRLLLQRLNYLRPQQPQFVVRGIDIDGEHPVNCRLERFRSLAKKDRRLARGPPGPPVPELG